MPRSRFIFKLISEHLPAVNVGRTGTVFRMLFLIYTCLDKVKPVELLTQPN